MRRPIIISVAALIGVLAIGGALAASRHLPIKPPAPAAAPPTVPVVGGVVTSHDVPIYLQGVGTVIAYNTVVVRSQIQDAIAGDGAQHERAGREARPVDDHPLAGLPHAREGLKIVADKAAGARQDAQIRARLRHGEQGQDGCKKEASHFTSPASS